MEMAQEAKQWLTATDHPHGPDMSAKYALAMSRVKVNSCRTAAQILRGQGMLPPCPATVEAQKRLIVIQIDEKEAARQAEQLQLMRDAYEQNPLVLKGKHLSARLAALRTGARPGGSRMTNDVLDAIAGSRGGFRELLRWCQLRADGQIPTRIGEAFCDQVMRTLRKENGKARNISLTETLMRLASAATQETTRSSCQSEGLYLTGTKTVPTQADQS